MDLNISAEEGVRALASALLPFLKSRTAFTTFFRFVQIAQSEIVNQRSGDQVDIAFPAIGLYVV